MAVLLAPPGLPRGEPSQTHVGNGRAFRILTARGGEFLLMENVKTAGIRTVVARRAAGVRVRRRGPPRGRRRSMGIPQLHGSRCSRGGSGGTWEAPPDPT